MKRLKANRHCNDQMGLDQKKPRIAWHAKRADDQELVDASTLIQSFQGGSARRSDDANYYRWKLHGNPSGDGAMWIVKDDRKVVGTASLTPKRLMIGHRMACAAEIGDTYTHPDYQRKGIFSTLVNSVRKDAFDNKAIEFIYGTPNQNSLPGYEKKLNFRQIPRAGVLNLVRPLRMGRVARGRLGNTRKARIATIGMRLAYAVWYRPKEPFRTVQVTIDDMFPVETDSLWRIVADACDVIMVRDSAYLEWRFGTNPDQYTIWGVRDSRELVGYVVTKPGLWRGLKVLYIADYLMLPARESAFGEALTTILQHARSQEADMISCWTVAYSEYAQVLKKRGFLRFRDVPLICYANEFATPVIHADYKWHFTMADSDNI